MKIIFLIFFIISIGSADDIVFTYGKTITNVQIIEEDDFSVKVRKSNDKELRFRKETILKIIKKTYNPNEPSKHIFSEPDVIKEIKVDQDKPSKYPNLKRWPISVVSFTLSIVLLADAGNIQNEIDEIKQSSYSGSISHLEDEKKFNNTLGFICLIAGIANTVYMILPVKISSKNNQVYLSYRF